MSESRKGTCAECSAEYKIPASFPHDRAKCRECGGVVEIAPAPGAAAPAPVPAAKPPEPKPEPKPEPAAEAPAEPAEKPMTMKEKILARKKAEADAAAAAEAPKPAAKKAAPKKPAGKPAGKKASKKAGGRKAAGAKGGRRGRGAEPEAEEGGGRRGRKAAPEKKPPVMGFVALAVLVIGGGAGWYFTMGPGATKDAPKTTVATGDENLTDGTTDGATDGVEEPMLTDGEGTEDTAAASTDEGNPDEGDATDVVTPDPEPEAPKPEKTYDPMEVQYDAYAVFGPAIDTSDEQWTEIQELVETFADMDAGAKQGRAGRNLDEFGFRAIPAIVNKMRDFDLGSDEGYRLGYLFQGKMTELMNGINAGWESEKDEDGLSVPRAHRYNRKVVETYLKTWTEVVEDPTRWIATAKLGQEKYADQLEAYSIALANEGITEGDYIDRVVGATPAGDFGDDEEGLDDF